MIASYLGTDERSHQPLRSHRHLSAAVDDTPLRFHCPVSSAQREDSYGESLRALIDASIRADLDRASCHLPPEPAVNLAAGRVGRVGSGPSPRVSPHRGAGLTASIGARGDALGGRRRAGVAQCGSRFVGVRRRPRAEGRALGAARPQCPLPTRMGAPWHSARPSGSHHSRRDTDHHGHPHADRHGRSPRGSPSARDHGGPDPP